MIKHISFDLWLTLIKSHPDFKIERAKLIAEKYNDRNLSITEIEQSVRETDKIIDRENEEKGIKIPAVEMFFRVLKKFNRTDDSRILEMAGILKTESDKLFLDYPPVFLNENIPFIIEELNSRGYTLNISSNTGFIESGILLAVLDNWGLLKYFSFCIFSDEVKTSKPSPLFFERVHNKTNLLKEEILHVGDNLVADYEGAVNFGFEAILITKNYTINDINDRL